MKFQIIIAVLATLLMPVHGALRQCAGSLSNRYEPSGFLTSSFTQNACTASGGSIDPNKKGNQKCCNVPGVRQDDFNASCNKQKGQGNFSKYQPITQAC